VDFGNIYHKMTMMKLHNDWIINGVLDIEYKQYELLTYLQKIEKKFDNLKLYPYFSDLTKHYVDLLEYKKTKKKLIKKIIYENLTINDGYILNIDNLIDFSLIELRKKINLGKFIYDEVEKCVDIVGIGPTSVVNDKGYFIIHDETIDVYGYELNPLNHIKTKIIRSYPNDYHFSYENIRMDLICDSQIINPPTFLIDTPIKYPIKETLIPITKILLVKELSQPKIF